MRHTSPYEERMKKKEKNYLREHRRRFREIIKYVHIHAQDVNNRHKPFTVYAI